MRELVERLRGLIEEAHTIEDAYGCIQADYILPASLSRRGDELFFLARWERTLYLVRLSSSDPGSLGTRLDGSIYNEGVFTLEVVDTGGLKTELLWRALPFTKPSRVGGYRKSFGTGDRLGLFTRSQASVFIDGDLVPVLAQQSMRELSLAKRSYRDVARSAAVGLLASGYRGPYGFDGDHLKSLAEIEEALDAGATLITVDLSRVLDTRGLTSGEEELETLYMELPAEERARMEGLYADSEIELESLSISFSRRSLKRAAVSYGSAIAFLRSAYELVKRKRVGDEDGADLEVSIDEVPHDTKYAHHYFVAQELRSLAVPIASLAPKFCGSMEKAVEYDGNLEEFRENISIHGQIARLCGGYKISVHSGSDKFSIYPAIAEETHGTFHVKTSGTFWLEAVRTIAETDPPLFEKIFAAGMERFEELKERYRLSGEKCRIEKIEEREAKGYVDYLNQRDSRQMLHVSYGAVLVDSELRSRIYTSLLSNEERLSHHVSRHLRAHLDLLGS